MATPKKTATKVVKKNPSSAKSAATAPKKNVMPAPKKNAGGQSKAMGLKKGPATG